MHFKLKLYSLFLFIILLSATPVTASMIKVESFAMPQKFLNKISQPLNLIFSAEGKWKLLIENIDGKVINTDNPNYSIPLTNLEVAELGGNPITNFDTGKIIELKSGESFGLNNIGISLNVILSDITRAGNYVTDIKFTLITQDNQVSEDIYCFRFTRDEIAAIEFSRNLVNLKVDKDKVFINNFSQNLSNPLEVYIKANRDWKLYVRKITPQNDNFTCHVKVLGSDNSVSCNNNYDYMLMNETPILLASGKSTINDCANCLDKKLIYVDYLIKGPENKILPPGSNFEEFEYRLETEN